MTKEHAGIYTSNRNTMMELNQSRDKKREEDEEWSVTNSPKAEGKPWKMVLRSMNTMDYPVDNRLVARMSDIETEENKTTNAFIINLKKGELPIALASQRQKIANNDRGQMIIDDENFGVDEEQFNINDPDQNQILIPDDNDIEDEFKDL